MHGRAGDLLEPAAQQRRSIEWNQGPPYSEPLFSDWGHPDLLLQIIKANYLESLEFS
jgi:hypothetical protein